LELIKCCLILTLATSIAAAQSGQGLPAAQTAPSPVVPNHYNVGAVSDSAEARAREINQAPVVPSSAPAKSAGNNTGAILIGALAAAGGAYLLLLPGAIDIAYFQAA
jgi:hypothetical protein